MSKLAEFHGLHYFLSQYETVVAMEEDTSERPTLLSICSTAVNTKHADSGEPFCRALARCEADGDVVELQRANNTWVTLASADMYRERVLEQGLPLSEKSSDMKVDSAPPVLDDGYVETTETQRDE